MTTSTTESTRSSKAKIQQASMYHVHCLDGEQCPALAAKLKGQVSTFTVCLGLCTRDSDLGETLIGLHLRYIAPVCPYIHVVTVFFFYNMNSTLTLTEYSFLIFPTCLSRQ